MPALLPIGFSAPAAIEQICPIMALTCVFVSAPEGIRTPNLLIRRSRESRPPESIGARWRYMTALHFREIGHRIHRRPPAWLHLGYIRGLHSAYLRGFSGGTSSVGIALMRKRSKWGTVKAA